MKLAALGVATAGVGAALGIPGLLGIGLFWVLAGLVARAYKQRFEEAKQGAAATAPDAQAGRTPTVDGRTFAAGTLLWLVIGIPSLAVGLFTIGIGADHEAWRWLPIAVGAFALVIGVLGAVLYGAGSAVQAVSGVPDKPATVWIRTVRETGAFVNERPRLEFVFQVEPEASTGLTPYQVTKKATVPFTAVGSLQIGTGFKALVVGPDKPTSMEIHWESPVGTKTPSQADPAADVSARLDDLEQLRRDAKISDDEYAAQRQRILGSI
jgi:hypothetical protein